MLRRQCEVGRARRLSPPWRRTRRWLRRRMRQATALRRHDCLLVVAEKWIAQNSMVFLWKMILFAIDDILCPPSKSITSKWNESNELFTRRRAKIKLIYQKQNKSKLLLSTQITKRKWRSLGQNPIIRLYLTGFFLGPGGPSPMRPLKGRETNEHGIQVATGFLFLFAPTTSYCIWQ